MVTLPYSFLRTSLEAAVIYLKESLNIDLPLLADAIACSYSLKHPHGCREMKYPYFEI
jgi:hypothetical protein